MPLHYSKMYRCGALGTGTWSPPVQPGGFFSSAASEAPVTLAGGAINASDPAAMSKGATGAKAIAPVAALFGTHTYAYGSFPRAIFARILWRRANLLVLEVWIFIFCKCLAEFARFEAPDSPFSWKSRIKRSFWKSESSVFLEVYRLLIQVVQKDPDSEILQKWSYRILIQRPCRWSQLVVQDSASCGPTQSWYKDDAESWYRDLAEVLHTWS